MLPLIGKEFIKKIKHSIEYIKYSYLHTDGALFRCVESTPDDCRRARNHWIEKGYLLGKRQIIYNTQSGERFLVFSPNIKGYIVFIEIATARIKYISRSNFFSKYNIAGPDNQPEILDGTKAYELMLKAYHLQFNKKRKIN